MIYQFMITHMIFPIYDLLFKAKIRKYLRYLKKVDQMELRTIKDEQRKKLALLLNHAIDNVSKYESICKCEDPFELLHRFPVMTRSDIISYDENLMSNHKKKTFEISSSGSTGKQVKVFLDYEEYSKQQATQLHWLGWIGYKYGNRIIQIGLNKKKHWTRNLKDHILNTDYFIYYDATSNDRVEMLKRNKNKSNIFLMGFPNAVIDLIKLSASEGIILDIKGIMTFGEKMTKENKEMIRQVYNVPIINTYGASEGVMIAAGFENEEMYLMEQNVVLEIVDGYGKEVSNGEYGRVLITNLNAYNMPLIRYEIGDFAQKSKLVDKQSKNRFNYQKLNEVIGRDLDCLYTPEKRKFHLFYISNETKDLKNQVQEFQWHQKYIDEIEILYIPLNEKDLSSELKEIITKRIKDKLESEKIKIKFIKVDQMKHYKSMKMQKMISEVDVNDL